MKKINTKEKIENTENIRFIWEERSAENLKQILLTSEYQNRISNLNEIILKCGNNQNYCIDSAVSNLSETITDAAKLALKHRKINKKSHSTRKRRKKWFDEECSSLRKEVRSLLNALNRNPFNKHIREKYFYTLKIYKRSIKKKKNIFKNIFS